jgi:Na+/H+ antiporter NhaD/arsenite permease-like protein
MMIIVSVIHKTGFFEYLAIKAIKLAKGNPKTA